MGVFIDPNWFPWWPVSATIGLTVGLMAKWGFFKSWRNVAVTGFVVALTVVVVSAPIAVYLFGGITANNSSFITAYLLQTGQGIIAAVFSTGFLTEPVGKITTAMMAFAIVQSLPNRFVSRFPHPENVRVEENMLQRNIALGIVMFLMVFSAFVLRNLLG